MVVPIGIQYTLNQSCALQSADQDSQAPDDLKDELLATVQQLKQTRLESQLCVTAAGDTPSTAAKLAVAGFSEAAGQLIEPALLRGRPVVAVAFPDISKPLLAAAYGTAEHESEACSCVLAMRRCAAELTPAALAAMGCLAVWDLSSPSSPAAVFVGESAPLCCVWGPMHCSHVLAAGTQVRYLWKACTAEVTCTRIVVLTRATYGRLKCAHVQDGSLYLWDLREADSAHNTVTLDTATYTVRTPTFSTACMAPALASAAAIVAIATTPLKSSETVASHDGSQSFGLVSLSEWGCLSVWSALSTSEFESAGTGGAPDDGLRFGATFSRVVIAQVTMVDAIAVTISAQLHGY